MWNIDFRRISFCCSLLFFFISQAFPVSSGKYIKSEGGVLYGELLLSECGNEDLVALIVPGSGPIDLNGNSPSLYCNNLMMLADSLSSNCINTFRFSKRGVGRSSFLRLDEQATTIDDYVIDVISIVQYLKDSLGIPKICLIGHSQGSLIAAVAAQKVEVEGIISVCGTGSSAFNTIKEQLSKGDNYNNEAVNGILDSLVAGNIVNDIPDELMIVFRPSIQPFLISWFKLDPVIEYNKLKCFSIILSGGMDIQLNESDAMLLSSDDRPYYSITNMNHLMKSVKGYEQNLDSYRNPHYQISSELIDQIVKFCKML